MIIILTIPNLKLLNLLSTSVFFFFKNGNWHRTQKCIADHASFALHNLFSLFTHVEISIYRKCKLFDALVGSILNYSSEIWGGHEAKDVELVHNKFCRKILHVRQSTNLNCLYGELGRVPLNVIRKNNHGQILIQNC